MKTLFILGSITAKLLSLTKLVLVVSNGVVGRPRKNAMNFFFLKAGGYVLFLSLDEFRNQ
jgi:hypothetical protein